MEGFLLFTVLIVIIVMVAAAETGKKIRQEEQKKLDDEYEQEMKIYEQKMVIYQTQLDKMQSGEVPADMSFINSVPVKPERKIYTPDLLGPTPKTMKCVRCNSSNIQISFNTVEHKTKGKADLRKKSLAERGLQSGGRTFMNVATLGLYGFFAPKKGKYKEYNKSNTKMIQCKMAICQNCGNSWKVL